MNPFDDIVDDDDSSDADSGDEQQERHDNELLVSYRKLLQEHRQVKGDMSRLYKICNDSQDMHQDEVENSVKLNRALTDRRMQCDSLEQKYYLLKTKYETLEKRHATQNRQASDISEHMLLKLKLDSETTIRELQSQVRSLKKDLATSKTQLEKAEASLSSHVAQSRSTASKSTSTTTTSSNLQLSSSSNSAGDNHLKVSPIMSFTPTFAGSGALGPVSPLFIYRSNSGSSSGGQPMVPPSPGIPKIPGVYADSPVTSPKFIDRSTASSDAASSDFHVTKTGPSFPKIPDSDAPVSRKQRSQTADSDDPGDRKTIAELRANIDSLTKELSESRSKLTIEIENHKKEEARVSKLTEEVIFLQGQMRRGSSSNSDVVKAARLLPAVSLDAYPINDTSGAGGDSEHDNAPLLTRKDNDRTDFLSRLCSIF